jgi:adenylyl-sulfate kinase
LTTSFVVWFTGLSGSGKTTLASLLAADLAELGVRAEVLDGDAVRQNMSRDLGFSKADRDEHVRRLGLASQQLTEAGTCAIVAAISPYRAARRALRDANPRLCEVYCDCPLAVLIQRDPKGLYQKARLGQLPGFSGIDAPYEPPTAPEAHLHTDRERPEASAARVLDRLRELGFLKPQPG